MSPEHKYEKVADETYDSADDVEAIVTDGEDEPKKPSLCVIALVVGTFIYLVATGVIIGLQP
jgi:hypothetical protein